MEIHWTYHGLRRLRSWADRKAIEKDDVEEILRNPAQIVPGDGEARVAQEPWGEGLLRVVFVEEADERRVLTIYWTSQVSRYWSDDRCA